MDRLDIAGREWNTAECNGMQRRGTDWYIAIFAGLLVRRRAMNRSSRGGRMEGSRGGRPRRAPERLTLH